MQVFASTIFTTATLSSLLELSLAVSAARSLMCDERRSLILYGGEFLVKILDEKLKIINCMCLTHPLGQLQVLTVTDLQLQFFFFGFLYTYHTIFSNLLISCAKTLFYFHTMPKSSIKPKYHSSVFVSFPHAYCRPN